MPSSDRLPENQLFGRYRIVRLLGEGGMGAVYEAVHPILKKRVAIKTLLPALAVQADARARFLREGEAASRINHPNVVAVHDVGTEDATPYLVMEFLEGETLDALMERRVTLSVAESVDIMLPVISAVATGHDQGVIHRDLKPQNIFLARGPWGEAIPKVLDFGVSKLVGERADVALTGTQAVLGTVAYMSPEQARGARGVDAKSDQYAIGLILYEMVTGARAHPGESALEILHHIASGTIVPPRKARPDLLPAMDQALLRCLAAQPNDRFPSLRALGQALLPLAGERARLGLADGFHDPVITAVAGVPAQSSPRTMMMPPEGAAAAAASAPSGPSSPTAPTTPISDTGRARAGSTRILTPPPKRASESTFRQVASELGALPDLRKRSGARAAVIAAVLVAAGSAAAFVIARGGPSSHGSPGGEAQEPNTTAPAPSEPAAPPSAAVPETSPARAAVPETALAASAVPETSLARAATAGVRVARARHLDVRVIPANAEITLDDRAPVRGRLDVTIPADLGNHTLTFTADGYADEDVAFGADTAPPALVTLTKERSKTARPVHVRRGGARGAGPAGAGSPSAGATQPGTTPGEQPAPPPAAPSPAAANPAETPAAPRRGANNALILK